jgi:Dimethlysulfonioproprionate lyase
VRLAEQDLSTAQDVTTRSKPVVRHMPDLLQAVTAMFPEIASALAAIGSQLCWSQSSSYTDGILGEGFSDNYAWAELIGPAGIFPGDDFTLGFLLLGPNRHYIDHYHPAPELYLPLTAGSYWKKGDGDFIERRQGEVIWHPSMVIHATKTFAAPLIAAYVWTRDVATPAKLKLPDQ